MHKQILLWLLLVVGIGIRWWRYEYIPFQSDGDEMAYVFAGQSYLEYGTPFSWSVFDLRGRTHSTTMRLGDETKHAADTFPFVYPWFDHPPLLMLLEGYWTHLWGYHFPSMVPSVIIRFPLIMLSGITLILTYFVGKTFFSTNAGLLALGFMALSPSLIIGQRMVTGENVAIPLWLLSLLLVKRSPRYWWLAAGLNTLAGLAKITGLISIPVTVWYLIVKRQLKRAIFMGVLSGTLFLVIYGCYGYSINPEQFFMALQAQAHRFVGWSNPVFILSHPGFRYTTMLDMTYYLILLLGVAWMFDERDTQRRRYWVPVTLGMLVLIWITSAEQDMLGWYKLPLFTILTVLAGALAAHRKLDLTVTLLIYYTALSNLGLVRFPEHPLPNIGMVRWATILPLAIVSCLPLLHLSSRWFEKSKQGLLLLAFGILALSSVSAIHNHYYVLCKDRNCPLPLTTFKEWMLTPARPNNPSTLK